MMNQRWKLIANNFNVSYCPICGRRLLLRKIWDKSSFDSHTGQKIFRYQAHFACPEWKGFFRFASEHYSNPYNRGSSGYDGPHPMYVEATTSTGPDTWVLTP